MEKTIKGELERNIISSELLNDNSLLITSSDENDEYPTVSVRYIDKDVIKEDRIATLLPTIAIQHNESMIAVFITNQDQKEDTQRQKPPADVDFAEKRQRDLRGISEKKHHRGIPRACRNLQQHLL